jgi:hypothetical protein
VALISNVGGLHTALHQTSPLGLLRQEGVFVRWHKTQILTAMLMITAIANENEMRFFGFRRPAFAVDIMLKVYFKS